MLASAPWQSLIGPQNITLACNSCASQAGKKNLARILNASLKSKPLHLLLPLKREARLSVLCILQSGAPTLCGTSSSSSTVDPLPAAIVWGNLTMQCVNYIILFSFFKKSGNKLLIMDSNVAIKLCTHHPCLSVYSQMDNCAAPLIPKKFCTV